MEGSEQYQELSRLCRELINSIEIDASSVPEHIEALKSFVLKDHPLLVASSTGPYEYPDLFFSREEDLFSYFASNLGPGSRPSFSEYVLNPGFDQAKGNYCSQVFFIEASDDTAMLRYQSYKHWIGEATDYGRQRHSKDWMVYSQSQKEQGRFIIREYPSDPSLLFVSLHSFEDAFNLIRQYQLKKATEGLTLEQYFASPSSVVSSRSSP